MHAYPVARLAQVGCVCGLVGGLVALGRGVPAGNDDLDALTKALAAASHGVVRPEDLRWEDEGNLASDVMLGRGLLYLVESGGTRDVWRARVRLSPEGHPVDVVEAHNLTSTPLGDDGSLVVRGRYAAYATRAYGQVQSVTLLDLAGEGDRLKANGLLDRAMAWITNVQQTGRGEGIGRVDITLDTPARAVGLTLTERELLLELDGGRVVAFDLASGDVPPGVQGLHAQASIHLPKRLSHWAVDTVRAVPWIGPAPIAWLEDKAFAVRDALKQVAFKIKAGDSNELSVAAEPPPVLLDASEASVETAHWPPARIPTIWKSPEPGEGEWVPPDVPWLRKVPGTTEDAPPMFLRTFVRPDEERPYAKVLLVAMDMRQVDLEMEAGVEDPQPLVGPHGPGRLPRDPAIYQRVVAAFNGAFKTEHGHYGMMVHRRVLLPPVPGAASIVTLKDHRVGLGTWGAGRTWGGPVPSLRDIADDEVVSFRQNLDPLVDHGQVNPSGRSLWGFTLPGKGVQTERSGICVTTAGHLVYAWGDDVSALTLGKAMKMAGCDYGMHLDMNPFHTGFMFTNIEDLPAKKYKTELLSSGMEIPPDRYIQYAPKDFFYVLVHDPVPPRVDGAEGWQADPGVQPAPHWMPGLWRTRVSTAGGDVDLLDIEPGRARWRLRGDAAEAAGGRELAEDDARRVLLALGLGRASAPRGPGREGGGLLVVSDDGGLALLTSEEASSRSTEQALELPFLVLDGRATSTYADGGEAVARAALGMTPNGRVLIAQGTVAGDEPLAQALVRAGCSRAVALDAAKGAEHFLHRAGTTTPPHARYDSPVLYAIATPLKPRGFRFEARTAVAQAAQKK